MAKLLLNDDSAGKPESIHLMIGRRPVAAFGNSIGDKQMLEYTQAGDGARLMMLVHHDDDKREYAYGPKSKVGTFTDALMAAGEEEWLDRDQHEERLETYLRVREVKSRERINWQWRGDGACYRVFSLLDQSPIALPFTPCYVVLSRNSLRATVIDCGNTNDSSTNAFPIPKNA